MSVKDRIRWDEIYSNRTKNYPEPDSLLLDLVPAVIPEEKHRALDLAAGLGQNGVWLAEQGYSVDIMDISRVGLNRAGEALTERDITSANLLQVDIDKLILRRAGNCHNANEICPETYAVIVVFRYLRRPLFPILKEAIQSGGRIVYETFNRRYLEHVPDFNQDFLLNDGELESVFSNWRIVHHDDSTHISQLVAVKP